MKKLLKSFIALSLIAMMCVCPIISSASSETVADNYAGTCDWLITIKNPETLTAATSTKTFVVSAVAVEGAAVTLYAYNSNTGLYEKIYDAAGLPLETTVGASGLYAQQITLKEGQNKLMVYATNGVDDQAIYLDINLLSEGFIDKIKSFTIDFVNMF